MINNSAVGGNELGVAQLDPKKVTVQGDEKHIYNMKWGYVTSSISFIKSSF